MTAKSGPFIANGYTKTAGSTTEYQLWDTTGALYPGGVKMTPGSTAAFTVSDTTTAQTLQNKTLGTGTVASLETATSDTALANYGVSVLPYSTGAQTVTLSAPIAGMQKFLIVDSTLSPDTTGIFCAVYSGSTATFFRNNSTAYTEYIYVGLGPPHASLHLIGISTAIWATVNTFGNVKFSTQAVFST
jgi:hypothetical protein